MKKFRSKSQDRSKHKQKQLNSSPQLYSPQTGRARHLSDHNDLSDDDLDLDTNQRSAGLRQSRSMSNISQRSFRQKNVPKDESDSPVELSTADSAPGVIKIYGDSITPGAEYKSVLACTKSTAQELVKEAVERYGLSRRQHTDYALCEVIGRFVSYADEPEDDGYDHGRRYWQTECRRVVGNNEQPLLMQSYWKPNRGLVRRFELCRRAEVEGATIIDTGTSAFNANARRMLITKARTGHSFPNDAVTAQEGSPLTVNLSRTDSGINERDSDNSDVFWEDIREPTQTTMAPPDVSRNVDINTRRALPITIPGKGYQPVHGNYENAFTGHKEQDLSIRPPINIPYLLNLNGYNRSMDYVIYSIEDEVTVIIGPQGQVRASYGCIRLHAPDILPEHCWLFQEPPEKSGVAPPNNRRGTLLLHPHPHSRVLVNNWEIRGRTRVKSGDIISLGKHYVFLLKMPPSLKCSPVPGTRRAHNVTSSHIPEADSQNLSNRRNRKVMNKPPSMNENWKLTRCKDLERDRYRHKLVYVSSQEDAILEFITSLEISALKEFRLLPAYMFLMCVEYSSVTFSTQQTKDLLHKIHNCVQTRVWECSKRIARVHLDPPNHQLRERIEDVLTDMEPVFFWMNNLVELFGYLGDKQRNYYIDPYALESPRQSDTINRNYVSSGVLILRSFEDTLRSVFQQCVYYITKTLYAVLPAVTDSNPFQGEPAHYYDSNSPSVEGVLHIFQTTYEFVRRQEQHPLMTLQLFAYLAFFTNTSLFNTLMTKEGGKKYFNWIKGVQLRGNIDAVEDWAQQRGLDDVFKFHLTKINAVADLLATPKVHLMHGSWESMRRDFQDLNAAQLNHILTEYQTSPGKERPIHWFPPQDEMSQAMEKSDLMESFNSHPPMRPPSEGFVLDLSKPFPDQSFYDILRTANLRFGAHFDEWNTNRREGKINHIQAQKSSGYPSPSVGRLAYKENKSDGAKYTMSPPPYRRPPIPGQSSSPTSLIDSQGSSDDLESPIFQSVGTQNDSSSLEEYLKERYNKIKKIRSSEENLNNLYSKNKSHTGTNSETAHENITDEVPQQRAHAHSWRNFPSKDSGKLNNEQNSSFVKNNVVDDELKSPAKRVNAGSRNKSRHNNSYSAATRNTAFRAFHKHTSMTTTQHASDQRNDDGPPVQMFLTRKPNLTHSQSSSSSSLVSSLSEEKKTSSETTIGDNPVSQNANSEEPKTHLAHVKEQSDNVKVKKSSTNTETLSQAVHDSIYNSDSSKTAINKSAESKKQIDQPQEHDQVIPHKTASIEENAKKPVLDDTICGTTASVSEPQESHYVYVPPGSAKTRRKHGGLKVLPLTTDDQIHPKPVWDSTAPDEGVKESEMDSLLHNRTMTSETLTRVTNESPAEDDVFVIELERKEKGIGLGLIDGLYTALGEPGLYVRTLVAGSPAALDGRLQLGDRILAVNESSIVGSDYQSAMEIIRNAGKNLRLLVAKSDMSTTMKITASSC